MEEEVSGFAEEHPLDYAMDIARERGFTEEHSRSGNTIFLQKPGASLNRLGWPDAHAEVHYRKGMGWHVNFCGREGRW